MGEGVWEEYDGWNGVARDDDKNEYSRTIGNIVSIYAYSNNKNLIWSDISVSLLQYNIK